MYFNLQSDGKGYGAIIIPDGGYRNPVSVDSLKEEEVGEGIIRNKTHLILSGIDVFNFSVNEVPKNVEDLLAFSNRDRTMIDYFVFHQANRIINEAIRKKLKLEPGQVPYSLQQYGNTSSATIPVTIITQLKQQVEAQPLKMVFSGFGVGLSWSSLFTETDKFVCPALIEV
jgi:3-oxoacyl-[acyl-carrier-protein] synthase-3